MIDCWSLDAFYYRTFTTWNIHLVFFLVIQPRLIETIYTLSNLMEPTWKLCKKDLWKNIRKYTSILRMLSLLPFSCSLGFDSSLLKIENFPIALLWLSVIAYVANQPWIFWFKIRLWLSFTGQWTAGLSWEMFVQDPRTCNVAVDVADRDCGV